MGCEVCIEFLSELDYCPVCKFAFSKDRSVLIHQVYKSAKSTREVAVALKYVPIYPTENFIVGKINGSVKAKKREKVFAKDGYRCVYCGSGNFLEIEHKTPRSRGGSNAYENLQTACGNCNRDKSDLTHEEYLAYLDFCKNHIPHKSLSTKPIKRLRVEYLKNHTGTKNHR